MAKPRKEKGFILITVLFLLLLVALTAMSLNVKSGMQAKMTANQSADAQTYLGQLAVIEQSLWKLTGDPSWRVSGENYEYPDPAREPDPQKRIIYNRTVANSLINLYTDTIVISVRAPNATRTVNKSFRYNIDTPFLIRTPRQVCLDSAGNIFFADTGNHSIWKIDAFTGAILRVAGTGKSGFSGDGGPATEAQLNSPRGVCIDGMGNLYIADTNNNCIRKVSAGFISTVVNTTGSPPPFGSSGDGLAATLAKLNKPQGVSVDASGNIYIADTGNNKIRKVTAATGIISTAAGTGAAGSSGDGLDATLAQLSSPRSVFVDSALNIYIADTNNNRIRKFTVGGNISPVAGTGTAGHSGDGGPATSAQLNSPRSVFVDSALNIFIADRSNNEIRKVTASDGKINTIVNTSRTAGYSGDGGAATAAWIDGPAGIAVKSTGEVIISDTNNSCLRQVNTNTISTLPMTAGPGLNAPQGMATYYDASQKKLFLYIADQGNHRIRKLDTATNAISTVAGNGSTGPPLGDGWPATAAQLNSPAGVAVDASGNVYIADMTNNRIRKVTAATGFISTVAGNGSTGPPLGDGGPATAAHIDSPQGVSVDGAGNIYIADTSNHRIRKFTDGGNISTVVNTSGNQTGGTHLLGDGGAATAATLKSPQGVSVDASGNIYIADTANHRIRKVTAATGLISTVAGNGSTGPPLGDGGPATAAHIDSPQGVSVDAAGNLYIADTGNDVLRLVNIYTGTIRNLAGTGTSGYNGDSQPAVKARLSSPGGVALGLQKGGGRIFIGDTGNDRVRVLFLKTEQQVYGP